MLAALMVVVALMGVFLAVAGQQWSFIKRREMERELAFRGERIQRALLEHQTRKGRPATRLEDLTDQPQPSLLHVPPDPLTAEYDERGELVEGTGEWVLIHQGDRPGAPAGTSQRRRRSATPQVRPIIGVHSSSEEESIGAWGDLPPGTPYVEWRFENANIAAEPMQRATGQDWQRPDPPPGFGGLRVPGGPPIPDAGAAPSAGGGGGGLRGGRAR